MKIGYVQFAPVLSDLNANLAKIEGRPKDAPAADRPVLPELRSSGYNFGLPDQAHDLSEEIGRSRCVSRRRGWAG